ncbi:hypothetical protein OIO90_004909 [Microbotryomycetes sp. JL221]|nr:hypothetical protein OIO90_004909 [Microbotryomycetes sp. JL221]
MLVNVRPVAGHAIRTVPRSLVHIRFASTERAQQKASESASKAVEATKEGSQVAVDKAKQLAGNYADKAQQLAGSAGTIVSNALGSYKEPIFYNAAVAKELVKQVYVAEKLAPPSLAQVSYTYQSFFNDAKSASFWQQLWKSGEWKRWTLYAVEAYGIFKIGEMVGRRHVVGYKLDGEFRDPLNSSLSQSSNMGSNLTETRYANLT